MRTIYLVVWLSASEPRVPMFEAEMSVQDACEESSRVGGKVYEITQEYGYFNTLELVCKATVEPAKKRWSADYKPGESR